jgi:hypothetical protein
MDTAMTDLHDFVGEWEMAVDLPGAEDVRGHVLFERMGNVLVQRTTLPTPDAPDSWCVVLTRPDGSHVQHYFDARGVARLYAMTFDGDTWTLERTEADFSPLDFQQRFIGRFSEDRTTIDGEWQTSEDGRVWKRDFGLTYTRGHARDRSGDRKDLLAVTTTTLGS